MVIQHSMTSAFAGRQLGINEKNTVKSVNKLSSGYKISSATDNAAGLAMSEKLRIQVRGLNRASLNIQDGTSLVQTGDSGMNEVAAMCQRIRELSVQAGNDTYTLEDREVMQTEIDWLLEEIDQIANDTQFNEIKILAGGGQSSGGGTVTGDTFQIDMDLTQAIPGSIPLEIFGEDISLDYTYDAVNNTVQVEGKHTSAGQDPLGDILKELDSLFGWNHTFGGSNDDTLSSIERTSDGGYLLVGTTNSNDGDIGDKTIQTPDVGFAPDGARPGVEQDITDSSTKEQVVIKLNSKGEVVWKQVLGWDHGSTATSGSQNQGYKGVELANGDFAIMGITRTQWSMNADISFTILDKDGSYKSSGLIDPTHSSNTIGANDIIVTENGFAVVGINRVGGSTYNSFMVEIGFDGVERKSVSFPGDADKNDTINRMVRRPDGSYILVGVGNSAVNAGTSQVHGNDDIWIYELDSDLRPISTRFVGTSGKDSPTGIQLTPDGGYIVTGNIATTAGTALDGDMSGLNGKGNNDIFAMKFDALGNQQWVKTYGGSGNDNASQMIINPDGTFGIIGSTNSNDGDVSGNHGGWDGWVLNIDVDGNILSQNCIGGTGDDTISTLKNGANGSYVYGGSTTSFDQDITDRDPARPEDGGNDIWVGAYEGTLNDRSVELPLKEIILGRAADGSDIKIVFEQCTSLIEKNGSKVKHLTLVAKLVGQSIPASAPKGINIQVGSGAFQKLVVVPADMRIKTLFPPTGEIFVESHADATLALTRMDDAMELIAKDRTRFGGYENALAHIYANVTNASENQQQAESRVRDTDMAAEMVEYSKNNILSQYINALLAQSNQQRGDVLQLLS